MRRLRPLSEQECYIRCYGSRDEFVKVRDAPEPRDREQPWNGENLRQLFEDRLDARADAEAA